MGSVNSLAEANREEDLSTNQRDGKEESRTLIEDQGDKEETKTLTEDLKETEEEDGDEDEECGLCKYIKGGECKDAFISLEECVDEAEEKGESDVTKCKEARVMFKTCMYENPVYYEPLLAGEAKAIAKLLSDLYTGKEAILAGEIEVIAKAVSKLQTEEAEPILPAQAAAIGKAFSELEAEKKKNKEAEGSKGNESDRQNQN